jgi:peptidoglycan/LPS O-acetylase OafA/YrhL
MTRDGRIETLDALRGIASLGVCWFHLTTVNQAFLSDGIVKSSGWYGALGVQIFFVISGFVIPFALWRSEYKPRDYPRFLLKRILRLDPPYLIAIAAGLLLTCLSAAIRGFGWRTPYSTVQILLHLGYLNTLAGFDWVNPVFWTLAIEFQYYLLIGCVYHLVSSRKVWRRIATGIAFAALAFTFPQEQFIFHWLFLFVFGLLIFNYKVGLLDRRALVPGLILASIGAGLTVNPIVAVVGLTTALLIGFATVKARILTFLGQISYSLYLVHFPVGVRLINFSTYYPLSPLEKALALGGALVASILAAYLMYLAIERPAQQWSKAIQFKPSHEYVPTVEERVRVLS